MIIHKDRNSKSVLVTPETFVFGKAARGKTEASLVDSLLFLIRSSDKSMGEPVGRLLYHQRIETSGFGGILSCIRLYFFGSTICHQPCGF